MAEVIKKSSKGVDVVELQLMLNRILKLMPPLVPDGDFGDTTEKKLKEFQEKYGLASDGIAGQKTWKKIKSLLSHNPFPLLRPGASGAGVATLQAMLNVTMDIQPPLSLDGKFGPGTEKQVKIFQASAGIGIDGVVGPKSWKALEVALKGGVISPAVSATPSMGVANWLKIAEKEIGQTEIRGEQNNPKIVEYHKTTTIGAQADEVPWCSSFVNWVMIEAGLEGTNSALAASWLSWGEKTRAKTGAIAVIKNARAANSSLTSTGNHVGFLLKETGSHYVLLGGNQSNQVKISSYPKSAWKLRGYRWPADNG